MTTQTTSTYVPDALTSLRDSFALHLDATRADKTTVIYLAALEALIAHLAANGMPTTARGVRREHVESYLAARRDHVKPATLSMEFRALQQFWRWALGLAAARRPRFADPHPAGVRGGVRDAPDDDRAGTGGGREAPSDTPTRHFRVCPQELDPMAGRGGHRGR